MISCGYIVYTDVYRDRHEQAWKHRLHAVGASEPLPRCYSDPPIRIIEATTRATAPTCQRQAHKPYKSSPG
jgi:hypothetical protein